MLQLAAQLRIDIEFDGDRVEAYKREPGEMGYYCPSENLEPDAAAAMRRVIVDVAACIGAGYPVGHGRELVL